MPGGSLERDRTAGRNPAGTATSGVASLPERLVAAGRFAEAAIAFRSQLELAPDRAELWCGLARSLEGSGDLRGALEALQHLIADDTDARQSRARIQEKLRIYAGVASLFPGGQVRAAGLAQSVLRVAPVEIHYPGTQPPAATQTLLAAAERALGLVERRLGWRPATLPVHLVPDGENMTDHGDRSWITALASDGVVRLRMSDLTAREPQHLAVVVTHEVVHIAVDHLSASRAPAWLGEGLAVRLSQALPEASERLLTEAVAANAAIPVEVLARSFLVLADRDLVRLAYAQAASLVEFLEKRYGDGWVADLVRQLAEVSLADALRAHRLNPYLLEREWMRWRRSQH